MDNDEMANALARFADERIGPEGHVVTGLTRLSGGASRETFSLDLVAPDGTTTPAVVQRVRGSTVLSVPTMVGEGELLQAAARGGVAVAPVLGASDDPSIIGAPFVLMARVEGETLARKILRDDEFADARRSVVAQCGDALARIHALSTDVAPHLRAADPVDQLVGLLDSLGEPHPAFELAIGWLTANRPAEVEPRVVHGDFRLGNLIVGPDGLRAVLDWELAHLGDPMEDLGWMCVRSWRFGKGALPVGGFGTRDQLFEGYAAEGGTVDAPRVHWWEVLGTLKWGIVCESMVHAWLTGSERDVEKAAIGRRASEAESDLLALICPEEAH